MHFLVEFCFLLTVGVLHTAAETTTVYQCTKNTSSYYDQYGLFEGDQKKIVDLHNKKRQEVASGQCGGLNGAMFPPACNMAKMEWDDNLAYWAGEHVKGCWYSHWNPAAGQAVNQLGQNLFIIKSSSKPLTEKDMWESAVNNWASESEKFDPNSREPFVFNKPAAHFTQIAWGNTTKVGCAFSWFTEPDSPPDVRYQALYTCQYYFNGNIMDETMYEISGGQCTNPCKRDSQYPNLCKQ